MKIVAYNMRSGGAGGRNWRYLIDSFAPDVILAQESYSPEKCHLSEAEQGRVAWELAELTKGWGSAVYVRRGSSQRLQIASFTGWLVGIELTDISGLESLGKPLRIFSLHTPSSAFSGRGYPATVIQMLKEIRSNQGDADLIVGGDFNLYSLGIRHLSERKNGKIWKTTRTECEILRILQDELGLVHCWQTANPDVPLAQTLRWGKNPKPAFHCDGIFVPKSWHAQISCTIVHNEEWTSGCDGKPARSDHNPLIATVIPGPRAV